MHNCLRKCLANPQQSLPILVYITFVSLEPWLKVAFKGRPNIIWLLALFITYETYNITFTSYITSYLILPLTLQVRSPLYLRSPQALHNLILIEGAIFFKIGHFSPPNYSSSETMKNVFYFIWKPFFFLEIFKFLYFQIPLFFSLSPIAFEDDQR